MNKKIHVYFYSDMFITFMNCHRQTSVAISVNFFLITVTHTLSKKGWCYSPCYIVYTVRT